MISITKNINFKFWICLVFISWCLFFASPQANAGTIIRAPAYLGLTNGLIGCWNFDGAYTKVPDCSGNNNVGTITGAAKDTGKVGQALVFDGIDDVVTAGDLDITGAFTISAWIKSDVIPGGSTYEDIVTRATGTGSTGDYWLEILGDEVEVGFNIGGTPHVLDTTNVNLVADRWYHLVGTYSDPDDRLEVYVDGVSRRSGSDSGSLSTNNSSLKIGAGYSGEEFDGMIDDVRVYNRVLSVSEITRLYRISLGSTVNRSNTSGDSSLNRGLMGYWTFDGADIFGTSARDKSGRNNHGTISGPVKDLGKVGQALSFDGINDLVDLGSPTDMDFSQENAFTISAWVKPSTVATQGTIFSRGAVAGGQQDMIYFLAQYGFNNNEWYAQVHDGVNEIEELTNSDSLSVNVWQHLLVTWDGTNLKLYKDAQLIGSNNGTFTGLWDGDGAQDRQTAIGVDARTGNDDNFSGLIEDVRVYNRALSYSEIRNLYQQSQSKFNSSKIDTLTNGLVGYWTFDAPDISGTRAKDKSGVNNHGTITGAVQDTGKIGQALSFGFDAVGINVSLGSPTTLDNINVKTICSWIYPRSFGTSANDSSIATKYSGNVGGWFFQLSDDDSGIQALYFSQTFSGNDGVWHTAANSITLNSWQHVCVSYDRTSTSNVPSLYINGVLRAITTVSTPTVGVESDASENMLIGNIDFGSTQSSFDGIIDDFRIYNRALSASEINKLYQIGR